MFPVSIFPNFALELNLDIEIGRSVSKKSNTFF